MAVYIITGTLGAGKTLCAVGKMHESLLNGRPVASNVELFLKEGFGRMRGNPDDPNQLRYYRLPARPTSDDLLNIGWGSPEHDKKEDNWGWIVLDECASWLNSQGWNEKGAKELVDWLRHARKYHWNVGLVIQDPESMNKQARQSVGEHLVVCRRTDRVGLGFFKYLFLPLMMLGFKVRLPRVHVASVRYGKGVSSPLKELWTYRGDNLLSFYDTDQKFYEGGEQGGASCELPPWYTYGRYVGEKSGDWYMRLTKILFRKYNRVAVAVAGVSIGASIPLFAMHSQQAETDTPASVEAKKKPSASAVASEFTEIFKSVNYAGESEVTVFYEGHSSVIHRYHFDHPDLGRINSDSPLFDKATITKLGDCSVMIEYAGVVHTSSCKKQHALFAAVSQG